MNYFLSLINLETWNMLEEVKKEGHIETVLATKEMKPGDIVFFYVGKEKNLETAGIYAMGEIMTNPYIYYGKPEEYCHQKNSVDVQFIKFECNEPFITYDECKKYINQFRSTHRLEEKAGKKLYEMMLHPKRKKEVQLNKKIKEYLEKNNPNEFLIRIESDLKVREEFIKKFTIPFIKNMDYDDYVMGKAETSETGRNSFCYILERKLQKLGEARGANVTKFGFWYDKKTQHYDWNKPYGATIEEAFSNLKQELISLIINGNNHSYEEITNSSFAPTVRSKILTTYYPDSYLGIFKEEDVDKFLNALEIHYDIYKYNTAEKKKLLLKEWKENHPLLKEVSDYYFVNFLYDVFAHELEIEHTVNGELDYDFEFVNFHYLGIHEAEKKERIRSIDTDYEKMNRNKKDIGDRGEIAVLNYEKKKLIDAGLEKLASQIAKNPNDAAGYDIDSFDIKGNPIHIEVKTNSGNSNQTIHFYLTNRELEKMKEDDKYYIYYLYNIKKKIKCHIINRNNLLEFESLFEPIAYKINLDVEVIS